MNIIVHDFPANPNQQMSALIAIVNSTPSVRKQVQTPPLSRMTACIPLHVSMAMNRNNDLKP
jgi:hypothetical protein